MKQTIEFLKKDRKVNDTFIKKLKKIGLEVYCGTYQYWDQQEYVEIGRTRVWLVKAHYSNSGNSQSCVWRYQNYVIQDILNVIEKEVEIAEKSDELVSDFFRKLGLEE